MERLIWNIIGFILRWPRCKQCNIRLTLEDHSDEYCNAHCEDDIGLGITEAYPETIPLELPSPTPHPVIVVGEHDEVVS
jgi:hypothetical protein